jgi:16S rRNA (adenine1518-N6/adenine1519-N6)-dimethyltransferase
LVRVAFSQRRKLLRHTLGRWLEEKAFTGVFNVQRRAEEVQVDEFIALALEVAAEWVLKAAIKASTEPA